MATSLLALPAAWLLPVEALRRKVAPIIDRQPSKEPAAAAPAPAGPAVPELERPLLGEAPPSPAAAERAGLSKALAILRWVGEGSRGTLTIAATRPFPQSLAPCLPRRYIEAITELGVAPPAGAGLYGFAALPLSYAAHHLAPAEGGPVLSCASGSYARALTHQRRVLRPIRCCRGAARLAWLLPVCWRPGFRL